MRGIEKFGRVLVFVAHPDDETIGCSGLLQRAEESLVVFAVDGAPPRYGFEKKFGSLRKYSEIRFAEAACALAYVSQCSMQRLTKRDGNFFLDQHLFLELPEAYDALIRAAREFSPDTVVSHAFEGGHIDHDACHFLARAAAQDLARPCLEFPLYWRAEDGKDVIQQFRNGHGEELTLQLSPKEIEAKRKMFGEYRTQQNLLSVFEPQCERFRPVGEKLDGEPGWRKYPFENRWRALKTGSFLRKVAEFHGVSQHRQHSTREGEHGG